MAIKYLKPSETLIRYVKRQFFLDKIKKIDLFIGI